MGVDFFVVVVVVLMLAALHQNNMILNDVRSKENFERPPFLICFLKVKL